MATVRLLAATAVTCIAALGVPAAGSAQQETGSVEGNASDGERRARATDSALLEALLKRRAEVARSASAAQGKRAALDFLDRRIAQVRSRIER